MERGQPIPIELPPGINRQGTEYETQGRWRDCDGVRFFQGLVIPRGSRQKTSMQQVGTRICGAHGWLDNAGTATLVVGTSNKLLVTQSQFSGSYSNITPAGFLDGRDDSARQYGYGIGPYGAETYGTPRAAHQPIGGLVTDAQNWYLDNRGQDLVACAPSDGKIYVWTPPDTGVAASQLLNSPINCLGSIVSPLYHIMALGADGDPRKIAWSDNVDTQIWSPEITNQAGFLQLEDDSKPVGAATYRRNVLVWTSSNAYELRPAPSPVWWSPVKIGGAAGIIAPRAWASNGIIVAWMGFRNFWLYDGASVRSLPCEVQDYVFNQLNSVQAAKVHAGHLPEFGEFVWYYPAETAEITEFVVWNYVENHWTIGRADATAYLAKSAFDYNLSWDPLGDTYGEEQGYRDAAYLESSGMEIGQGRDVFRLSYLTPDWSVRGIDQRIRPSTWKIYGKDAPRSIYRELTSTPLQGRSPDPRISLRGRARQLKVRLEAPGGYYWELGKMRLSVIQGGRG